MLDGRRKLLRESCLEAVEIIFSVKNRKYALNEKVSLQKSKKIEVDFSFSS